MESKFPDQTLHMREEPESVHFAHARRHIFAWRGPYVKIEFRSKLQGGVSDVAFFIIPHERIQSNRVIFLYLFSYVVSNESLLWNISFRKQ